MGKYTSSVIKHKPQKTKAPHFIWNGLGCMMIVIIPIISIAAGIQTVDYALQHGWILPAGLLGRPTLPDFFYKSSGLISIFGPITSINNLYAYAVASIVYVLAIGGVSSMAYAFAYRFVGPPRYGPQDIPPPNFKVKKYKR